MRREEKMQLRESARLEKEIRLNLEGLEYAS
jgi:hypothetical protein